MKLQSMTDYVLAEKLMLNIKGYEKDFISKTFNYANFLKLPLTLGMFIQKDENGNVLEEPKGWKAYIQTNGWKSLHPDALERCRIFAEAKKRVIFDGFEIIDTYLGSFKLFYDGFEYIFYNSDNVESIIKYNLTITENAVKKYGL